RRPRPGEHLAWGESSAVAYANSLLGARTNREGGPLTIMSALTGRTYYAGLHLEENRRPTVLVEAPAPSSGLEAGLLGGFLGRMLGGGEVPYVRGIPRGAPEHWLKGLCAAAGALGSLGLCLIEGVSPEASEPPGEAERLEVGRDDLRGLAEELGSSGDPELYYLGCPHASLAEVELLDSMLRGRVGAEFWVTLSRHQYAAARRLGIVESLEAKGVRVWRDTCPVVAPFRSLGYRVIATNSVKAAFYMPRIHGVEVVLMDLEEVARRAVQGL
ncbi:MAG: aconitase X, partial [Candidatus Korarchaeota archaeon]|nr:aconitase X [Candidatus Korarchaeota archaeon]